METCGRKSRAHHPLCRTYLPIIMIIVNCHNRLFTLALNKLRTRMRHEEKVARDRVCKRTLYVDARTHSFVSGRRMTEINCLLRKRNAMQGVDTICPRSNFLHWTAN